MRNKKRMLAAGLIAVALLSTVNGCGSTTGNMQDTQSIQGTTGVAGGTVQGSAQRRKCIRHGVTEQQQHSRS